MTAWERGGMFLKMEAFFEVLGAGEGCSMSSSLLIRSFPTSSSATTAEEAADAEEAPEKACDCIYVTGSDSEALSEEEVVSEDMSTSCCCTAEEDVFVLS